MRNFTNNHPIINKIFRIAFKMLILVIFVNTVYFGAGIQNLPNAGVLLDFQRIDTKMEIVWIKIKMEIGKHVYNLKREMKNIKIDK